MATNQYGLNMNEYFSDQIATKEASGNPIGPDDKLYYIVYSSTDVRVLSVKYKDLDSLSDNYVYKDNHANPVPAFLKKE